MARELIADEENYQKHIRLYPDLPYKGPLGVREPGSPSGAGLLALTGGAGMNHSQAGHLVDENLRRLNTCELLVLGY